MRQGRQEEVSESGRSTAAEVAEQIRNGGDRLWTHADFSGLPIAAVNQALSRLTRSGQLQRVRKGLYYRPRPTLLGPSRPPSAAVAERVFSRLPTYPAGTNATSLLHLTTQQPARAEYASSVTNQPRGLTGVRVTGRRSRRRQGLSQEEGALLEVLRERARHSELDGPETARQLVAFLRDGDRFRRIADAAEDEPPRVRAMLGALGQEMGAERDALQALWASLNPTSRFSFGKLRALQYAREWQAK